MECVSLPAQLPQEGSSSCAGYTPTQGLCLQMPSSRASTLSPLRGAGTNPWSFDAAVPSAPFPSSTLVNFFSSTHTVLKKEGTVEVQLLANAGVPTGPQNPTHNTGTAGGHVLTWDTELRPQAACRPLLCP